ncbi:hypothetical protein [Brevibacillus sp. SYP-B805]|uniref:hypothetical protein n=1 Tax=Brevibacillus sp. SYP-B805 TaxID=1578199 RepID=UPI001F49BC3A|nr:hypothetical protein [Brevibacillus sp. SYP-B805]
MIDTQVEFGTLIKHVPVVIKLDQDPTPLEQEQNEIVLFKDTVFTSEDIGTRLALIRCTNGQYLVLGEV